MSIAAEAGHWYFSNGDPAYTIIGKNGKERKTTIADARELGLRVGTTTITGLIKSWGLQRYEKQQLLLAALTLPRLDGESEEDWIDRMWADADSHRDAAATRGKELHGAIQRHLQGEAVEEALRPFVAAATGAVEAAFPGRKWITERTFASPLGYGGAVDLHCDGVVIDFKGTDKPLADIRCWPEHFMQTAAYREGLGMPGAECANVFIDRNMPVARLIRHDEADLQRAWAQFNARLHCWKVDNRIGYDPA